MTNRNKESIMTAYLEILRSTEEFQMLLSQIKEQRPVIPVYDHINDNTEAWKANSNILKGFNLVLTLLGEDII